MRPKKLVISAFCSYPDRTEIDFDALGESGIYLITGSTGAGKTTIFDAITYALFDKGSGDSSTHRDSSSFRSSYAEPTTPTYVELTFENAGHVYFVRRNPDYVRPRADGKGTTVQAASAELDFDDGRIVNKNKTAVNDEITRILGITREQFIQTTMIAQGEFLKVLLASVKDKQEILRKIFSSQNYLALQERLGSESKKLNDEAKRLAGDIYIYTKNIQCELSSLYYASCAAAKDGAITIDEFIEILKSMNADDENLLKQLENDRDKRVNEMNISSAKLDAAEKRQKMKESLEKSRKLLALQENQLRQLALERDEASKKKPRITEIVGIVSGLRNELPEYSRLTSLTKRLNEQTGLIAKGEAKIKQLTSDIEKNQSEIDRQRQLIAQLAGADIRSIENENKVNGLSKQQKDADSISMELKKLDSLQSELDAAQQKCKRETEESLRLRRDYDDKYTHYIAEQAGFLAESLAEGAPCPVCGSTHHPQLAEKSPYAPTKAQLDAAKRMADSSEKRASSLAGDANLLTGKIETSAKQIVSSANQLFPVSTIDDVRVYLAEYAAAIEKELADAEKLLARSRLEVKQLNSLNVSLPKAEKEAEQLKSDRVDAEKQLAENRSTASGLQEQITDVGKKLTFQTEAQANAEISKLTNESAAIEKAISKTEADYRNYENEKTKLIGSIAEAEKNLAAGEDIDAASEKAVYERLKAEKKQLDERLGDVKSRLDSNTRNLSSIIESNEKSRDVQKKASWVNTLSATANGNLAKKDRIKLETYILAVYYDRVIDKANARFRIMTGGQYELVRREKAANAVSECGLDLDVIDHNSGTQRDVKSLSGGESFKASLALALGLSDEIQSTSGGIHLDTMFVDEGFGSLDDVSLDQALAALGGLSDGSRLVGIISHVHELQERIDKQIIVEKDQNGGSHVKMIV